MDNSKNLELPYLIAAQAQKHVTHNEALRMLDAIVQLSVLDRDLTDTPATPVSGDRYIVGALAVGNWLGKEGQIAAYQDNGWVYYTPREGWLSWVADEGKLLSFDGIAWNEIGGGSVNPAALVGINTLADPVNRLAVSAPNTLFSHEGSDHRVKINKAVVGDTASVLFQNGFSGRSEIGLAGDDDFHFKVSADGSSWSDALTIKASTGNLGVGTAPQSGAGVMKIGGALQVTRQTNAFATSSSYTAFIMGAPGSRGGAYLVGRANVNSEPFVGLSGWDAGVHRDLFYGGGGWGAPDATRHWFYTAATTDETNNGGVLRLKIQNDGTTEPGADNAYSFGSASKRWSDIFAANGTINTSDLREKRDIEGCELGLDFIARLNPVSYRWKTGRNEVQAVPAHAKQKPGAGRENITIRPGLRAHYGLIAQEVRSVLEETGHKDFAGWTLADKNNPDSTQGLRYNEFIAPLIKAVQELKQQLDQLQGSS